MKDTVVHNDINDIGSIVRIANHYRRINKDIKVYISINNTDITGFSEACSWRGNYSEPTLVVGDNHNINDFIDVVESLVFEEFEGYKGGSYEYDYHHKLHIEYCSSSCYNEVMFSHTVYNESENSLTFIADEEW